MSQNHLTRKKDPPVSNRSFWLSFIPVLGGLSIVRESNQLKDTTGTQLGWGIFALSIVTALAGRAIFVAWLLQIGLAIWLKAKHAKPAASPPLPQVDFNNCSKHELVYTLNLPIVYANDIDLLRNEGHLFTYAEELIEIVGIPAAAVERITPQLIFSYDAQKDNGYTWHQMNILTASEMVARGVTEIIAQKIEAERLLNGDYRSAVDVKKRTGVAFRDYQKLV